MESMEKIAKLGALKALGQKMKENLPGKVSELENDAGYQTGEQVEEKINARLSSAYRPGGSVAFAALPELTEANLGVMVNVTDAFTTTDSFTEGAGAAYPAGTNVAVVQAGNTYKYDAMSGIVDLSGYVRAEEGKGLSSNDFTAADKEKLDGLEIATDAEVTAMLEEVFGS